MCTCSMESVYIVSSASLFLEPRYAAPPRPPHPPVVPPPPAQDYSDSYRRGGPRVTADTTDGQNAIVYNSPHSSIKFYPSAGRMFYNRHRCSYIPPPSSFLPCYALYHTKHEIHTHPY